MTYYCGQCNIGYRDNKLCLIASELIKTTPSCSNLAATRSNDFVPAIFHPSPRISGSVKYEKSRSLVRGVSINFFSLMFSFSRVRLCQKERLFVIYILKGSITLIDTCDIYVIAKICILQRVVIAVLGNEFKTVQVFKTALSFIYQRPCNTLTTMNLMTVRNHTSRTFVELRSPVA